MALARRWQALNNFANLGFLASGDRLRLVPRGFRTRPASPVLNGQVRLDKRGWEGTTCEYVKCWSCALRNRPI